MQRYHEVILSCVFFFNDTATTEIYTLSLHDALPISRTSRSAISSVSGWPVSLLLARSRLRDRKSTRLNSSHSQILYAVFCVKKKLHTDQVRDYFMQRNHGVLSSFGGTTSYDAVNLPS